MSSITERESLPKKPLGLNRLLKIITKWFLGFGRVSLIEVIARDLAKTPIRALNPGSPSILLIRRNRMGDMICTLPLFRTIRNAIPLAKITVACDALGEPIARACPLVDDVILLRTGSGLSRWWGLIEDAAELQSFDYVIAVKGGFDFRLACLTRWTNAPIRIGYTSDEKVAKRFYTAAVDLPTNHYDEHQVETQLRLLEPLGIREFSKQFELTIPENSRDFATQVLSQPPFSPKVPFLLFNVSSTTPIRFSKGNQIDLIRRILNTTSLAVGIVSGPKQRELAKGMVQEIGSVRVREINTPSPLDLAALLERASAFITPEGGAAHLACVTKTPALILWSEGPFNKWRSLGENHRFVLPIGPNAGLEPAKVWSTFEELQLKYA